MRGIFLPTRSIRLRHALAWLLTGLVLLLCCSLSQSSASMHTFIVSEVLLCGIFLPGLLLNIGAFFHVDEDSVHARYHWFGKLDCPLDEIRFVYAQTNTLTLLMKNGKRYHIGGIANAWVLCMEMLRKIFTPETVSADVLKQELQSIRMCRKKELFRCICGIVQMFLNILVTALLTGGRELHEFSTWDWCLFGAMTVVGIGTLIYAFYYAEAYGKKQLTEIHLQYRLQNRTLVLQEFASSGTLKKVYATPDCHKRLVVCDFPEHSYFYISIQKFTAPDGSLITTHGHEYNYDKDEGHDTERSVDYDAFMAERFGDLVDLTPLFVHSPK